MGHKCAVWAVLCFACALAASGPAAAGQYAVGVETGTSVEVEALERARFLSALPFDVQFYIQIPAGDDLKVASGIYAERRGANTCPAALASNNPSPAVIDPVGFATRNNARKFELSVRAPGLGPNRDYCFQFTLRFSVDPQEVRMLVAEALDESLRRTYRGEATLSEDEAFRRFRAGVIQAIDAARRKKQAEKGLTLTVVAPEKSFFDPKLEELSPAELRSFTRVLQVQATKAAAVDNVRNLSADAEDALRSLASDAAAQRMVTQLRAATDVASVANRLSGLEQALNLVDGDVERLNPLTLGIRNDGAAPQNLDRVWDPAAYNQRITNLQATIRDTDQLAQLASQLSTNTTLRNNARLGTAVNGKPNPQSVTPDALRQISTVAEAARDSLTEVLGALRAAQDSLVVRAAAIRDMTSEVVSEIVKVIDFAGTTTADWETRARSYVSADVGVAFSPPIDSFFFYFGANFYTGPVNRKAVLRWSEPGNFRKRFAFLAAIPLNPFDDTDQNQLAQVPGTPEGVLGDRPLLVGAGFRLTDLVRLTGGSVLFRVKDPNPLVESKHLDGAWFMAFSVDWDLRGLFSGLGGQTPQVKP